MSGTGDQRSEAGPVLWSGRRLRDPHSVGDKALRVREMFDRIAPTYQRVNRLASAGRDAVWRRALVDMATVRCADRVLDVACGTGDLAGVFREAGAGEVVGLDFAREMLLRCQRPDASSSWCQADALKLPFGDGSFDIVSCAFGIRNFQVLQTGLSEMFRVLAPGGRAMILEFTMPEIVPLRWAYSFYFSVVMPRLATWVSRDDSGAYSYLPQSVATFPEPAEVVKCFEKVGFSAVNTRRMSLGIVQLLRADKN